MPGAPPTVIPTVVKKYIHTCVQGEMRVARRELALTGSELGPGRPARAIPVVHLRRNASMSTVRDARRDGTGQGAVPDATTPAAAAVHGGRVESSSQSYQLFPWRRSGRTITWSNATEDLSESDGNRQQHVRWALVPDTVELVREAFAAWEAVTDLDFREVADGPDSDIRIGLTGGSDSTGGILAYTTSWSQEADAVESVIAVDFDAVAQLDRAGSWTPTHLYNIALHEIGHAIGLDDSQVQGAVMYSAYDVSTTTRLALHQDDLDGVKAIYSRSNRGSSSPPAPVPSAPVVPLGDLSVQPGPAGGSGTVEGNGQDYFSFDLSASSGVRFELRNLTADADLYLLSVEDSSTTVLAQSVRAGTAVDTITRTLGAGSYYVRIDAYADGPVDYQLHVTTPPADGQTRHTAAPLGDLTDLASPRT